MNDLKTIINDNEWFYEAKKQFNKQFNGLSDQLVLLEEEINHNAILFTLNDKLIRFGKNKEDAIWDDEKSEFMYLKRTNFWDEIEIKKVILNKDTSIIDKATPKLLANSCNEISYVLYPFDQGAEISLKGLGYNDLQELDGNYTDECIKFDNNNDFLIKALGCSRSVHWNGFDICIGHYENNVGQYINGIIYVVARNNNIISCFIDESNTYQEGDGHTCYYLNGDDLIIVNDGDVSSVVVIKYDEHLIKAAR
jgi:hypothetical protein